MKKEFSSFLVLDLFSIKKGTQKNMNSLESGSTPLVSAKKIDNGFKDFVKAENKEIFKSHCITLNNDGDGGAGLAFYQPSDFVLDTHVTALYPIEDLNRYQMLYIANCISKQRVLFGHGHSINSSRISHLTCMLPIDENGQPDYDFMEQYMKAIEKKLLKRYQHYLAGIRRNSQTNKKLPKVEWKHFPIEDIFMVSPGIRLTKDAMVEGNRPFVGASDSNNGITAFCGNTNKSLDSNVLGVNYNGSVVENFYHPYEAIFSDDVKRLHLKEHVGNKYIYLFIKNIILKQKEKFQYGYKFNGDRMLRTSIKLPIGSDGQPDYEYMEQYMKAIEHRLINRYIEKRLKTL